MRVVFVDANYNVVILLKNDGSGYQYQLAQVVVLMLIHTVMMLILLHVVVVGMGGWYSSNGDLDTAHHEEE